MPGCPCQFIFVRQKHPIIKLLKFYCNSPLPLQQLQTEHRLFSLIAIIKKSHGGKKIPSLQIDQNLIQKVFRTVCRILQYQIVIQRKYRLLFHLQQIRIFVYLFCAYPDIGFCVFVVFHGVKKQHLPAAAKSCQRKMHLQNLGPSPYIGNGFTHLGRSQDFLNRCSIHIIFSIRILWFIHHDIIDFQILPVRKRIHAFLYHHCIIICQPQFSDLAVRFILKIRRRNHIHPLKIFCKIQIGLHIKIP